MEGFDLTKGLKTVMFPTANLEMAEYNPRTISPSELDKLKKGLKEFGCVQPIVANKATATIKGNARVIGGHQRLTAARALGWTEIPTVLINEHSEKREKALNLALNRIGGTWDFDKLGDLLADLDVDGFDIELSGFDVGELKQLEGIDESIAESFGGFEPARTAAAPEDFPTFDESIKTDYKCPSCGYSWSGKPRGGE